MEALSTIGKGLFKKETAQAATHLKQSQNAMRFIFASWISLFTMIPFLIIFVMSLFRKDLEGNILTTFTLENYVRLCKFLYIKVLFKTLAMASTATLGCLLLGLPIAYFLSRCKGQLKQVGLILLFIPFWTNFILRIYGILSLLGNNGLLNHLLMELGLGSVRILYTRVGIIVGLIYNYLPFLVVPIFSSLEKLDPLLREAALDLGASRSQIFWKVTLPNIREGVLIGSLFVFIPMMGEYVIPDLLGGANEVFWGNLITNQFFSMQDWPFGASLAVLLSFLLMIALFLKYRFLPQKKLYA